MSCVTMIAVRSLRTREKLADRRRDGDVESRQRFVQKQELGVGRESTRDRDALRLAAGELPGSRGANSTASTSPSQRSGDLVGTRRGCRCCAA